MNRLNEANAIGIRTGSILARRGSVAGRATRAGSSGRRVAGIVACAIAAALATAVPSMAQPIGVSGRPVPTMTQFDDLMVDYMNLHDIEAGVLGIMNGDQIVYLRGFGQIDDGIQMPENALVRLASVTKTITSAATRRLIADGAFGLNDQAFDIYSTGEGGLLPVDPWDPGSVFLPFITVEHLLRHTAGWDRDVAGDLTYMETTVAADLGIPSPPGRMNTLSWILSRSLQDFPGSNTSYSNIGCLSLGLLIEHQTGQGLLQYVRQNVLTPSMWVPSTELRQGATFREWRNIREPWYRHDGTAPNVFDDFGPPQVSPPYGAWDHEARIGQGGMIASAAAILRVAQHYHVGIGTTNANIGVARADQEITFSQGHSGSFRGTNTMLWQRTDGASFFVFVNKRSDGEDSYSSELREQINDLLDDGVTWPTVTADGFWVQPFSIWGGGDYAQGGYDARINGFTKAMETLTAGSRVRLSPGSHDWTGTINVRMEFDAPLGEVTIGQ